MDKLQKYKLFTPSGCLTAEGLSLYTKGVLPGAEVWEVKNHLHTCELCTMAVEGYALANPEIFAADVELINQRLEKPSVSESAKPNDPVLSSVDGLEGPRFPRLSQEKIREITKHIHENSAQPEDDIAAEKTLIKEPPATFWRRYRFEFLAAGILLLLAIGGWQFVLEYNKSASSKSMAIVKEEPDTDEVAIFTPDRTPLPPPVSANKAGQLPSSPEVAKKLKTETVHTSTVQIVEDDLELSENIAPEGIAIPDTEATKLSEQESAQESSVQVDEVAAVPLAYKPTNNSKKSSRSSAVNAVAEEEIAETEIFTVVEESPQYPGGDEARIKFLQENISYPQIARESSIQGTVYVTFVVERDGTITDVRILREIGGGCDDEAVRVVQKMPRWIPGKQRGKPVRVQFNMPIKFTLAE